MKLIDWLWRNLLWIIFLPAHISQGTRYKDWMNDELR